MASDVAKIEDSEVGTVVPLDPFLQGIFARMVATGHYVGRNAILMQALGARTLEEATNIGKVLSGKATTDVRLRFVSVVYADSDETLDGKLPWFALADVVMEGGTGEVQKLSCGAEHVFGTLLMADENDLYPFEAYIASRDLGGAKKALNLQLAPHRVGVDQDF